MNICANIKAGVEKLIMWHKVLPTYIEGGVVYIESKTGHPYMVGKGICSDIVVKGGVIYCVVNVL